tara:strand:- start:1386 stop:1631 length:246 start_codon:yes stop_codon:yes gene_type:complete
MLEPEPCVHTINPKIRFIRKFNQYIECIKEDLKGKWKIEEEIPLIEECHDSIKHLKELGEDTTRFEESLSVLITKIKNELK